MIRELKTWVVTCDRCRATVTVQSCSKPPTGESDKHEELNGWGREIIPATHWSCSNDVIELCPKCVKAREEAQ